MKKIILSLLCIVCLAQSACERDDICAAATETTPLLVIEFFDVDDRSQEKSPTNLSITSESTGIPGRVIALVDGEATVSIPLRTDDNSTNFLFELDSDLDEDDDEETQANTDQIIFEYIRSEEFVSVACGFRVIYNSLEETRDALDDGAWIQDIDITNSTVNDETTTHVIIFF